VSPRLYHAKPHLGSHDYRPPDSTAQYLTGAESAVNEIPMWQFFMHMVQGWFMGWYIVMQMIVDPIPLDQFKLRVDPERPVQEVVIWRINAENPLREGLNGIDYERCAALHNLIVEYGWTSAGNWLADLDRTTWWESYGGDSALSEHAHKLDESVIAFLKRAIVGSRTFHRYNGGLSHPEVLWGDDVLCADYEDESGKRQFITLYMANYEHVWGHSMGLVLDQVEFTATQQLSMEDDDLTMSPYQRSRWVALEEILDAFLQMIDQGKTVTVGDSYSGQSEKIGPWVLKSYSEDDLEDALEAFDALITAIEAKMPSPPPETGFEIGLISAEALAQFDTFRPDTLARRFLERARKPRFKYLAPGLQLAYGPQPFASVRLDHEDMLRPVLLFQSSLPAYNETEKTPWGEDWPISPWHEDFRQVAQFPAGLYLTAAWQHGTNSFEDGCKLLLPFTIGENRWARTSDLALYNEREDGLDGTPLASSRSSLLFQQGYNHFIQGHDVQLKNVIWRWTWLVEQGIWEVDEDGVKGGMEKWREADTEEHWWKYVMPKSW
jgi:hypothetical protein